MSAHFTIEEILKATGGEAHSGEWPTERYSISTDTRTISPKNVYLCLKGEKFDAHAFIPQAIEQGVQVIIVQGESQVPKDVDESVTIIQVADTLQALMDLATFHRKRMNSKIIAITGSSGKTTTKELVYSALATKFNTLKSPLNYNNEIGVSKTLLEITPETEITICEMGMRGLGEIDILAKTAIPDIRVITNVGPCHIGRLGSLENIAIAKTELLKEACPQTNSVFLYGDDALLLEYAKKVYEGPMTHFGKEEDFSIKEMSQTGMTFTYKNETFEVFIPGKHNVINASVAIEIGKSLGMNYQEIYDGLKTYRPLVGRWEETPLQNGTKVINDAYNANPDSMKAAIEAILMTYKTEKIWLVLGDMLELGDYSDKMHKELGIWLKDKRFERLITVGASAKLISEGFNNNNKSVSFDTADQAANEIEKSFPTETIILLKASRGLGLEKIIDLIGQKVGGRNN